MTEPNPDTILCKVVDVNLAIQNSFKKFLDAEDKTLETLANILRDEMSQIELFAPATEMQLSKSESKSESESESESTPANTF